MGIVRMLVALLFAAFAGMGLAYVVRGADFPSRLEVSYVLSAAPGSVEVCARVARWPAGLRFGWGGNEGQLGVEAIAVLDGQGSAVAPVVSVEPFKSSTRRWYDPRLDGRPVEIRYRVNPPPIEDGARGTPSRIGCVQSDCVALLPEQLYLCFDGGTTARVEVAAHVPADWVTVSPEVLEGGQYRGPSGPEWSPWVTGRFDAEEIADTGWRLHVARSLPTELVAALRADLDVARALVREFTSGAEKTRTHFVFAPRAEDGIPAGFLEEADLLFMNVAAHYPRLRADVVRRAIASFSASRPPTEAWFGLALAEWLADKSCSEQASVGVMENRLRAYESHGDEMDVQNVDESQYSGDYWREAWVAKSVAVLFAIESLLSRGEVPGGLGGLARDWTDGEALTDALQERLGPQALARIGGYLRQGGFPMDRRVPIRFEAQPCQVEGAAQPPLAVLGFACSGSGAGRLESCGCTGSVTGGIPKRATVIAEAKHAQNHPEQVPIAIELGDFLTHQAPSVLSGIQDREQRLYAELLASIPSDVVVVGQGELLRGPAWFRATVESAALPTVSSNLWAEGRRVAEPFRIVRRGSLSIAFVGWSDPWMEERDYRSFGDTTRDVVVDESYHDLGEILSSASERSDLTVVAGRIGARTLEALLARYGEQIDIVVTMDPGVMHGAPVAQRHRTGGFVGRTLVLIHPLRDNGVSFFEVEVGTHQALSWTVKGRLLDGSVPNDQAVSERLDRFYSSLAVGDAHARRLFTSDSYVGDDFVDEERCRDCHEEQGLQWQTTRHSKAFDSLVRAARQNHPDCVRCHVTGFAWSSGYLVTDPDPEKRHVGCQMCHGSGGRHVAGPTKGNIRRTPERETCTECHDDKHSPDFRSEFEAYWREVVHAPRPDGASSVGLAEAPIPAGEGEGR